MFPSKERREEFRFSGLENFQKCHIPVLEKYLDVAPQLVIGEILLLQTPFGCILLVVPTLSVKAKVQLRNLQVLQRCWCCCRVSWSSSGQKAGD